MIDLRNAINCNPFEENHLEPDGPRFIPSKYSISKSFLKIPIVIACTIVVFILLIAGTALTAISYPPQPPYWRESEEVEGRERLRLHTALDGNYKLLGPLIIMGGGFLLIIDVVLCVVITKEAYLSSRVIRPSSDIVANAPMSLWGGPFFLAVPSSTGNQQSASSFDFTRQLWAMPNAPLPDFAIDGGPLKGSRVRPSTATLSRCNQHPFNPDIEKSNAED